MNYNIEEFRNKSKQLAQKLQEYQQSLGDQKKQKKIGEEIKKMQSDLEKYWNQMKTYWDKIHFDKQFYTNTNNDIKRALNQPTEGNIQNAMNKWNQFIEKLAA